MSTRQVIRDISQLIKDLAVVQSELKTTLGQPHTAHSGAQMVEARDRRVKITACLNYLHELKGHCNADMAYRLGAQLSTGIQHRVTDDDMVLYATHLAWLRETSAQNLDPKVVEGSVEHLQQMFERELVRKHARERMEDCCPASTPKESWLTRLLTAVGSALK